MLVYRSHWMTKQSGFWSDKGSAKCCLSMPLVSICVSVCVHIYMCVCVCMHCQKKRPNPLSNPKHTKDKEVTLVSPAPHLTTVTGLQVLSPGSGLTSRLSAWPAGYEYRHPATPEGDIGTSFLLLITHHDRLTEEPPPCKIASGHKYKTSNI